MKYDKKTSQKFEKLVRRNIFPDPFFGQGFEIIKVK